MYQQFRPARITKGVLNLILINGILFLATWAIAKQTAHQESPVDLRQMLGLYFPTTPEFKWYQIFTHMFMHEGFMHIAVNMYGLWLFGTKLENVWDTKRFILFYFICGLGSVVLSWTAGYAGLVDLYSYSIGASGDVSGLLVGYSFLFPSTEFMIIPIPIPIKIKNLALIFAGYDLIFGLLNLDNVGHFAHLGGMAAGLLTLLYWRKSNRRTLY